MHAFQIWVPLFSGSWVNNAYLLFYIVGFFLSNLTYIHVSTLLCRRLNVAEQYSAHQFHNMTEDLYCDAVDLRRSEFCLPFNHNVRWQTNDVVDDHKYYQDDVDCLTSWRQAHYLRFENCILQHNAVNAVSLFIIKI